MEEYLISNIFKFMRNGDEYGTYLYRNIINDVLLLSYDEPKNGYDYLYKGEEIGFDNDASIYIGNA
jgi:hypothetical protein